MEIVVRTEADLDELAALARRVRDHDNYPIYEPAEGLRWFLTNPEPVAAWVARSDGSIIGHVALHPTATRGAMRVVAEREAERGVERGLDARPAFVSRLLVDPERRGRRIGALLLEHARREAIRSGHVPYLEAVDVPDGAAALALYRSEGWTEIGRTVFELFGDGIEEVVFAGPSA